MLASPGQLFQVLAACSCRPLSRWWTHALTTSKQLPSACCLLLQTAVKIVETRIDNIKAAPPPGPVADTVAAAPSTSAAAAAGSAAPTAQEAARATAGEAAGSSAVEAAEAAGPTQQSKTPAAGDLSHSCLCCLVRLGAVSILTG